mmetsp:Transcript_14771/g.22895  ORF Transcript_14771/g.22895 Transcript_14771/m.22895 type:complete len:374 (+) Transcript_14771:591-1712(+)
MIKLVPQGVSEQDLFQVFGNFYQDEQDAVRMQGIDSCVHFSKVLPKAKVNSLLVPYIKKLAVDKSWRIRYLVADKIMEVTEGIGIDQAKEHLVSFYCSFLEDSESEVRTAAIRRLCDFGKMLDVKTLCTTVIPSLTKLKSDQFMYVRQALAENILSICPIIDKGPTNDHILPIFLELLRDESSDVRLNLFKKLDELNKVIGLENLQQSIVPALKELSEDKNWRIKISVVEQYPALAQQLGDQFFTEKLLPFCFKWLSDSVYSIRIAAVNNLKELTSIFGSQWAEKNVLKKVVDLRQEQNYLHRLTALFGMTELSTVLLPDAIKRSFVPALQHMAQDKVPNIRLNVAKTIYSIRTRKVDPSMASMESQVESDLL